MAAKSPSPASMTDAQLVEFAREFRIGILDGGKPDFMCAAICFPLVTLLNMSGVSAQLRETKSVITRRGETNHIWIELADGRVLDPTADQFNGPGWRRMPDVYLGKRTKLHRPGPPGP